MRTLYMSYRLPPKLPPKPVRSIDPLMTSYTVDTRRVSTQNFTGHQFRSREGSGMAREEGTDRDYPSSDCQWMGATEDHHDTAEVPPSALLPSEASPLLL